MKVLHFNTFESAGGAASAAFRLHKSLQKEGVESIMAVKYKNSSDPSIFQIGKNIFQSPIMQKLKRNPLTYFFYGKLRMLNKFFLKNSNILLFNPDQSKISFNDIASVLKKVDVICLHWIDGFLSAELISKIQQGSNIPIVWILQDTEPLTGGCHYPLGCEGFKNKCGSCPQLNSKNPSDKSRKIWERKNKFLKPLNITFIVPSYWMKNKLKESSLFQEKPFKDILLGINMDIFKKIPIESARDVLNLPKDKKIIFFGSQDLKDERKGMHCLVKSFEKLHSRLSESHPALISSVLLLSAGRETLETEIKKYFTHKHLGLIKDTATLAKAYQSANIFACPSIEDAGPMMINESVACKTPVVAFDMGVARNILFDENRGYIAKLGDVDDFAFGLYKLLTDPTSHDWDTKDIDSGIIAKKYIDLFKELTQKKYA